MAIPIDNKPNVHIYQGMQSTGKALHQVLHQEVDDGLQEVVPETWMNVGCDERQITNGVNTVKFKRRVYRNDTVTINLLSNVVLHVDLFTITILSSSIASKLPLASK